MSKTNIDSIIEKHLGQPIDDTHYDGIKSALREFSQLQAKEAIEEIIKRQLQMSGTIDTSLLSGSINIIKSKFDIK